MKARVIIDVEIYDKKIVFSIFKKKNFEIFLKIFLTKFNFDTVSPRISSTNIFRMSE